MLRRRSSSPRIFYGRKATEVYEVLKRRIEDGEYQPKQLLPRTDSLAADFAASAATVNQAISRLVEEKYVSRKCGVGTRVEGIPAVPVRPKNNRDIGFYLPMLKGPDDQMSGNKSRVWIDIFSGAVTAAGSRGYRLCAIPDLGGTVAENISHYEVDGIIVYGGSNEVRDGFFEEFFRSGLDRRHHYLLINRDMDVRQFNYIEEVSVEAVEAALRQLVGDGHARIGILGTDNSIFCYCRQYEAHRKLLSELGCYSPELVKRIVQGSSQAGYDQAVKALMSLPEPPTALVVFRERFLGGTLNALEKLNIRVPEDLSVVVADNACELQSPDVAALVLPSKFEFGMRAVNLLIDQMTGAGREPVNADLPFSFRPGGSYRPLKMK